MLRNTRQTILDTAKKLLNERGYNSVSTRDIAEALGISKGNLTYYFKKKEEIIEAILAESSSTRTLTAPSNLFALNAFFEDVQTTVTENAFYFWHHTQLAQVSPKIYEMQHSAFEKNIMLLTMAFQTLTLDEIFRGERFPGEFERIIDTLLMSCIYWIPYCKLKDAKEPSNFLQQAWCILDPLLTEKGKRELEKVRSETALNS